MAKVLPSKWHRDNRLNYFKRRKNIDLRLILHNDKIHINYRIKKKKKPYELEDRVSAHLFILRWIGNFKTQLQLK